MTTLQKTSKTDAVSSSSHSPTIESESSGSFFGHLWASIAAMVILIIICCVFYPLLIWGIGQAVFPAQANGSLVKKDGTPAVKDEDVVGSSLIGQSFSMPGYIHPRFSAAGSGYDPTSSGGSNLGPLSDKLINGATNPPTTQPTATPESIAYDGIRLRTIHYAVDNGLSFKLYNIAPDGSKTEVPLAKFQDTQGNLNDVALVDAFPHPPADAADRTVLIGGDFKTASGDPVSIPVDAVTASASGLDPHISPANAILQAKRVADTRHINVDEVKALIDKHTDQPAFGFIGDPGVNVLMLNLDLDVKYPLPPALAAQPAAPTTQPTK